MARARSIKPGFFKNEDLVALPPLTRLLFAGLWTLADREGRLEDRPRKIKLEVLPADKCNVDQMLQALHDAEFIQRYEVSGRKYIALPTWKKHQSPHVKEPVSTIPAPDSHGASPMRAPDKPKSSPSSSLTPSSLTPDSLNPKPPGEHTQTHSPPPAPSLPRSRLPEPPEAFKRFWQRYPHKVGEDDACRAWLSVVNTPADVEAVFACLARWERSGQWARKVYQKPENWLWENARSGWQDQPAEAASGREIEYPKLQ